jgi:hypothetical protein
VAQIAPIIKPTAKITREKISLSHSNPTDKKADSSESQSSSCCNGYPANNFGQYGMAKSKRNTSVKNETSNSTALGLY